MRIPSIEEIKDIIWRLHPLKSPGPDGFLGIFYRTYWDVIKDKLVSFVQECFKLKTIPENTNRPPEGTREAWNRLFLTVFRT